MKGSILAALTIAAALAAPGAPTQAQTPVQYTVRATAPEHHTLQIEALFTDVPDGTLELRMSRSSPGRYALHEFAKNVFRMRAVDGTGRELLVHRPEPSQWNVEGHDGTVRVTYEIYGDRADGTYLQIDRTHVHINGPATFMWPRGVLADRPVRVELAGPEGSDWQVATQLFETGDPTVFTAPNLRYLLDSPIEFGDTRIWEFDLHDGQRIRVALHHLGTDDSALAYLAGVELIVAESEHVFGEYPAFDGGTYTFIADYLPWADGDGMEHRNSTILTSSASLADAGVQLLGTVAHEFFHAWNVERIRPASLEPFDFERANASSELWLAEGFTSYYGALITARAGVADRSLLIARLADWVNAVTTSPGARLRSAAEMSELAPLVDAAQSVDPTYWDNTFVSYYTHGAALALALDLELRARSDGEVTLDTFMRGMWNAHGKPRAEPPPTVSRPYDMGDAERVLAETSGDPEFAATFFARHITGTEPIDFAPLLQRAGLVQRPGSDRAYLGIAFAEERGILYVGAPTAFDSPAYAAGLDEGDAILSIDGTRLNTLQRLDVLLRRHAPGDTLEVRFRRRDGTETETRITLGDNPAIEMFPIESAGGAPTAEQLAFREAWLGSQAR